MPSFNHEKFVAEAMKSVFEQSYDDIEFLIIDDCSTDSTFETIRRVAASPHFIRRFRRLMIGRNCSNLGAHRTLNRGLGSAQGQFVTFINSDDTYEPERFHCLASNRRPHNIPFLAFTAVKLIDEHGARVTAHQLKSVLENGPEQFRLQLPSLSFGFLRHQLTGSTGNIFINRALLNEIGGFSSLRYCHDWEFVLRALTIAEPCYIPETSYRYRIHGANTFSVLQHIADEDTAATLESYYRRVASGLVRNPKAPTPRNWPYVFDMIAREFGVYDAWMKESNYRPPYAMRQALFAGSSDNGNPS